MKVNKSFILLLALFFTFNSYAKVSSPSIKENLLIQYRKNHKTKEELVDLKKLTLLHGGNSVAALIEVMKNGKYPAKNRWIATLLLGEVMGSKSAPFISKFLKHPAWFMRAASLKTLLKLKDDRYGAQYTYLLKDDSIIVRTQALENIRLLKIERSAPMVWSMLYDKRNYAEPILNGKKLKRSRGKIIKDVILTIGELKFEKAKGPLLKMIQKDKYVDIFNEMDLALANITGNKSPSSDIKMKRIFWQRAKLDTAIF